MRLLAAKAEIRRNADAPPGPDPDSEKVRSPSAFRALSERFQNIVGFPRVGEGAAALQPSRRSARPLKNKPLE